MNQFFLCLSAILRNHPDMSHNLSTSFVSLRGELKEYRPVLVEDNLLVKSKGDTMPFIELPGANQADIIQKVTALIED